MTDSPWKEGDKVVITHFGKPVEVTVKRIRPKSATGYDSTVVTDIGDYPLHLMMVLHDDAVKKEKIKQRNLKCGN